MLGEMKTMTAGGIGEIGRITGASTVEGRTAPMTAREVFAGSKLAKEPAKDNEEVVVNKGSVGEAELIRAIERANQALTGPSVMLKFSIHEGTKQIMVRVINEETGEIVKEIPPENILNMVAKMWEMAGILVDEKV